MNFSARQFWEWSIAFYAKAEIEHTCLSLQERCQVHVNILLACLWLAGQGRFISKPVLLDMAEAVKNWNDTIIEPLRRNRKRLEFFSSVLSVGEKQTMKSAISHTELKAERVSQRLLVDALNRAQFQDKTGTPKDFALESICCYLQILEQPIDSQAKTDIDTLIRAL